MTKRSNNSYKLQKGNKLSLIKSKRKSHNWTKKINSTKTKQKNLSIKTKTSKETKMILIEKINYLKITNPSIKKYTGNKLIINKSLTL